MIINYATPAFLPTMVKYGETFWKQTEFFLKYGIPYDEDTVTDMATHCMNEGVALYVEDEGKIVGLMLCLVVAFPMNRNYKQAVEWVFYVDEAHRKTGLGAQLIVEAERLLKEMDVAMLSMVCLANVTPDAAIGLYDKLGYKLSETSMTKDIR